MGTNISNIFGPSYLVRPLCVLVPVVPGPSFVVPVVLVPVVLVPVVLVPVVLVPVVLPPNKQQLTLDLIYY